MHGPTCISWGQSNTFLARSRVEPDKGSEDFGPGTKPFGQGSGYYNYTGNCTTALGPCHEWGQLKANRCPARPRGALLSERNPTCDVRTYRGGLATCLHGWHLLDEEQAVPWADQPLVYHKKFRVYFQSYNASHHKQITRQDYGVGAGGGAATPALATGGDEYTVPQCAANIGQVTIGLGRIVALHCRSSTLHRNR